ncbi:DNA-3-methyladenine glycosylase [Nesterenkonia jeotgali]|uniref:Putative 3-methyladenine DNA glycosylase n=1 Tax=Nesterenkonia jeotgali TaxID=317018 RepID=A0A0W8IJL5_9MICC|nr:DNA-3-methyladenine glycosylase [Nesterenkonia jeotgali]KUG60180.1 3-methyladenine DNA glycosylase [Nesterenkonia jeotgali]MBA8920353.1 DNA-3-methyladenine glycosylase [Nesterenkonia jeotgali]
MNSETLHALFEGHATVLAPALLGCELTVETAEGTVLIRLTEVEAYGDQGEDPGAHSFNGKTARNAALFGPPRHTYVYLNYGIHRCLNLACGPEGTAGGVLLRAGEVLAGRELAIQRRGGRETGAKLLSGPGRLGQGLGITLSMDAQQVQLPPASPVPPVSRPRQVSRLSPMQPPAQRSADSDAPARFTLTPPTAPVDAERIRSGPRVGVSGEGGRSVYPWRYWLDADPSVSAYRPGRNVPAEVSP